MRIVNGIIITHKNIIQVFVEDKVSFHGQAIGLLVAKTRQIAVEAAKKVKVTYTDVAKPVVDIADSLKNVEDAGLLAKHFMGTFSSRSDPSTEVKHTVKGELRIGSQYHFYMETMNCLCVPREDGIDMHVSTQVGWSAFRVKICISTCIITIYWLTVDGPHPKRSFCSIRNSVQQVNISHKIKERTTIINVIICFSVTA